MADLLELDFFNVEGEFANENKFSRRDSGIELEICYDYELARKCPRLIEFILAWKDREQKARAWVKRAPEFARSIAVLGNSIRWDRIAGGWYDRASRPS